MKLALECPTRMLSQVQPFADVDFLLTHLVLQDKEYADYYIKSNRPKILDNSVNELGTPTSLEDIKKAYDIIRKDNEIPLRVVSPDIPGDWGTTIKNFVDCKQMFPDVLAVLQGLTFEDVFKCLGYYIQLSGNEPPFIAVPYDICSLKTDPPELMSLRRALIVSNIPNNIPVHLLGFTTIEEFIWYKDRANITSVDTGVPVLTGLQNADILDPLVDKTKPTMELMEALQLTKENYGTVCRNIALLRTFI